MTKKEVIAEIKAQNLPLNTPVYKLKIIDGNNGNSENEYFLDEDERDSEYEWIEYPYFFERNTITFKESAFVS